MSNKCPNGCHISNPNLFVEPFILNLPTTIHPAMMTAHFEAEISLDTTFDIQYWIDTFINKKQVQLGNINTCLNCNFLLQTEVVMMSKPPYLHFEISPEMTNKIAPSTTFSLIDQNLTQTIYHLRAIIYLGQSHFTARLITANGLIWAYDSQCNNAIPLLEQAISHTSSELNKFQNRTAYIYVYQLTL